MKSIGKKWKPHEIIAQWKVEVFSSTLTCLGSTTKVLFFSTWYCLRLCFFETLDENGVADEREEFIALGMYNEDYIPCIQLFYNDDLTIA